MTGIVKKILLSSGIAFSALAGNALPPEDSIKVVKGQVSDYYIPVVNQYEITGTVVDEQGNPLEGRRVCNVGCDYRKNKSVWKIK